MLELKSVGEVSTSGGPRFLVYEKVGTKKKKVSRELRGIENLVFQVAQAEAAFAQSYVDSHRQSNEKKRDGWLRDMGDNLYKAARTGGKKLKLRNILNT